MSDIGRIEFGPHLAGPLGVSQTTPHVCQPDPVLLARLAAVERVAEYAEHQIRCAYRLTWRGVGPGIQEPDPCDCGLAEAEAEWRKAAVNPTTRTAEVCTTPRQSP